MYNKALEMDGLPTLYNPDNYIGGNSPGDKYLYPNNDFTGELTRQSAPMYHAGIQMDGKAKGVGYYINLNYQNNEGMLRYTNQNDGYSTQYGMNRINLRSNIDIDVIDNLEMDVDLGFIYQTNSGAGVGIETIWNSMLKTPPMLFNMINPDGSLGGTTDYRDNPYGLITAKGYTKNLDRDLNASFRAKYNFDWFIKGLSAGVNANVSDYAYIYDNKVKDFAVFDIEEGVAEEPYQYTIFGADSKLSWQSGTTYVRRTSFEGNFAYQTKFNEHDIDAVAVFRMSRLFQEGIHEKQSRMGISGRTSYSFKDRYLAQLAFSYEGSGAFHPDNRFGFFPALALGWVASNESLIKENLSLLSYLKFRASYGISGSDMFLTGSDISDRIFYNQYYGGLGGYTFGDDVSIGKGGYGPQRLANQLLTWEKSYKLDFGFDAVLWNNVSLGFTYFNDDRKDIFTLDANVPAISGINNAYKPYTNNGRVVNRGYETYVRYDYNAKDFSLGIGVMYDHNRSEIKQKADEPFYQYDNMSRIGHPVGQYFGMVSTGLYDGSSSYTPQAWEMLKEGDLMYTNLNGDKVVDESDIAAIGYTNIPENVYSLDLNVKFKNLSIYAMFQGIDHVSSMLSGQFMPFTDHSNAYTNIYDSWVPGKTDATLPRLSTLDSQNNYRSSTTWLVDASFIKLRNVEISYKIPQRYMDKCSISNFNVFVRGVNLLTFNNSFKLTDPERLSGLPNLKSYHLGVNVKF
jgi:TonB-linked SusC/RagA family outer membrane protein